MLATAKPAPVGTKPFDVPNFHMACISVAEKNFAATFFQNRCSLARSQQVHSNLLLEYLEPILWLPMALPHSFSARKERLLFNAKHWPSLLLSLWLIDRIPHQILLESLHPLRGVLSSCPLLTSFFY